MGAAFVGGAFDDMRSRDVRFLQEAARFGPLTVLLWPDEVVAARTGAPPRFPFEERAYLLGGLRYVRQVVADPAAATVSDPAAWARPGDTWVVRGTQASEADRMAAGSCGLRYHAISEPALAGFAVEAPPEHGDRARVIATGCFDWLHSGHVRFFEEASQFGDLTVGVGHDANIRLLKGAGHPLFPQDERRYMVAAVRSVHEAVITSGDGWMDAAPEIERLRPDYYVVNEDGDKPEKRSFCRDRGIQYVVLRRQPRPGLPRRQSTDLRGF